MTLINWVVQNSIEFENIVLGTFEYYKNHIFINCIIEEEKRGEPAGESSVYKMYLAGIYYIHKIAYRYMLSCQPHVLNVDRT